MAKTAFSILKEMSESASRVLDSFEYEDCDRESTFWRAEITISSTRLNIPVLTLKGLGLSKAAAKQTAASFALNIVQTAREHQPSPPANLRSSTPMSSSSLSSSPPSSSSLSSSSLSSAPAPSLPIALLASQQVGLSKKQLSVLDAASHDRSLLENMAYRRGISTQSAVFFAIDVEKNESGDEILEVGISWVDAVDVWNDNSIKSRHLVVKEHRHIRNGRHVPDAKDRFVYGASEALSLREIIRVMKVMVDGFRHEYDDVFLIGHSLQNDILWLKRAGIDLGDMVSATCDLAAVDQAERGSMYRRKLEVLAAECGIGCDVPHNAGNDAVYTLQLALAKMASLDMARFGGGGPGLGFFA